MAQYALMVWGPSEYGEFGTYASAEENAAQLDATCRRKIEVRPMGGE